jgi:hypothetical protein
MRSVDAVEVIRQVPQLPHIINHLDTPTHTSESKMPPKSQEADDKRQAAREVIDILQEISDLLVRAHPQ